MSKSAARSATTLMNLQKVDDFYDNTANSPQSIVRYLRQTEKQHSGVYLTEPSAEAAELMSVWKSDQGYDDGTGWLAEYERQAALEMLNDAEVLGEEHPDMAAFLEQPMIFMTGDMYGQGDRRNTYPGKWKPVEWPLIQWMNGPPGSDWGLTKNPVGKSKGGSSIVPSENLDGQRKDSAVKTMYAIGIDIDSGTSLDDTLDKLEEAGFFALVYTTFSHRKTRMELKSDAVLKALKLDDAPTKSQIQEYLQNHHKDNFSREFIEGIEVVSNKEHTADGLMIILDTPPLDKYRVIFPLAEPVDLADLGPTMNKWKEAWADLVTGVAVNILDAEFDSTSCDVNRLFYLPRHPEGAEFYNAVVQGKPLSVDDIKPYSKEKYVRQRKAIADPFLVDKDMKVGDQRVYNAPSGMNLNDWHRKAQDRFLIADVLETYCRDKLRKAGSERSETLHIECPFEHEHSSTGGTATMVMNPDANKEGVWTIFCHHDACQGRHKLEFLAQMLADEWFPEDVLKDEGFLIPLPDQDQEDPIGSLGSFEAPEDWLPAGYVPGESMIFFREGDDEETVNIPVCGVFDVVGRTADVSGIQGAGRIVSFLNENGIRTELTLDRASLYGNGPDVLRQLADAGLPMEAGSHKANERLLNLFRRMTPARLVPTLHRPGKHGDSFMLPTGKVIGDDTVRLHEDATFKDTQPMGTLEGWKSAANAALSFSEENPYWALTVCGGFAGPLLDILEWSPVGFVLSGETSKGKSLGQALAASIWANPADGKSIFWTASSTPNAYEDLAVYGSGTCLMLDELGAVQDKRQLSPLMFGLHTGRGKARKRGNGPGLTRTVEFRPFVVFSSESNIKAEVEAAGVPYRGGMAARFPDVDVGSGAKRTPEEIAEIEVFAKNYGRAGPSFIRYLMDTGVFDDAAKLAKEVSAIVEELARGRSPGIRRAARPFALAQRAGELAVEAGLLSDAGAVSRAVRSTWESFLSSSEAALADGSGAMLDAFRSWVAGEMDRTILRAGLGAPTDNADARGAVVGWYTDDMIYLDWKRLEALQIPGSFGKRAALCNALAEIGALNRSSVSNIPFTALPANVSAVSEGKGKRVKNMRIHREAFGV